MTSNTDERGSSADAANFIEGAAAEDWIASA
jgi:hypothetical protein